MHLAYNVHSILKQGVHIESIAAFGNNVILGTRSGQLIMYCVDENGSVDMKMFNKNFSKKAIAQLEVIESENLLFVLADNIIHTCDISRIETNFAFIHSSQITKGCNLFALDVKTPKSTTDETTTVRVCCSIKRRLQFFDWKMDSLHSPQLSIELKDIPKALCWVDDIVCVGFKDGYVIYNIRYNQPEKHDLIVTSSSNNLDPCICLIKNSILGVSKDEYLVPIDSTKFKKRKDDDSKDQRDLDAGKSNSDCNRSLKSMIWSGPVQALVWDDPYVIGRVLNTIEIRSLESNGINQDTLVQSISELGKIKFLVRAEKGMIFAAAISELWCIRMADIQLQRAQLLQQKKFQLAIDLTNISEESEEVKIETTRQIHMRYAKELFSNKQFSQAMSQFEKAAADPYDVIRLFPNLLQDQSNKALSIDSNNAVAPIVSTLEDKDWENAHIALIQFLATARQKEVVKLRDSKSASKSLLSIIDTTLLKCYLKTNDSLVAPLLRLNQCHLEESEKTLKKYDKISELIILYQTNGKHKKALELLQSQASNETSNLFGIDRTICYLQQLGSAHLPLILEFSDWVLSKEPIEGLRIFTDNFIEVENLPRVNVLDFLLSRHKTLVIPYLEHVIHGWKDSKSFLHNMLIKQYSERVQNLLNELKNSECENQSEKKNLVEGYIAKLQNFLKSSKNYSADAVLKDFPTNSMLEERALILGRLKKHEKVIAIYIQVLGNIEMATTYCEENYDDDNSIFLTLLKTILNPVKVPPYEGIELHPEFLSPNPDIVVDLLNKYSVKIDPCKIWPFLPDDMPLHRLQNYMNIVLRTQITQKNHFLIMEGLFRAEVLRMNEIIQDFGNKHVEITEFSICPECKKRFANQSAFVRYPDGEVVHLSCHDKRIQTLNI